MVDISFTLIMQWINFAILLGLLYVFLYKPLLTFLDKRAKGISSNIEEALNNKEKSLATLEEYQQKIKDIQTEADKMVSDACKGAEKEKNLILESAREESRRVIQSASEEIANEAEKAKHELKKAVSEMVLGCAEKVLEREIKETDHKKFISDFMEKSYS